MNELDNAAPRVEDLGIRDMSMPVETVNSLATPQHMPLFWIFASGGIVGRQFIDLGSTTLTNAYGDDTFDPKGKYYTHQTPYLQRAAANGNNCVVHRLMPPDAKDRANVVVYIDVLPTQVPLYQKQIDGSLVLDANGDPTPVLDGNGVATTVAGYKVALVPDFVEEDLGHYSVGLATVRQGIQVDGAVQSTQYPMFEVPAEFAGEDGLRLAIRAWAAMKTDQNPFPAGYLSESKTYPYYFQLMRLKNTTTGRIDPVLNGYGAQYARFTFKEGSVDPVSGVMTDLQEILETQYTDEKLSVKTGLGPTYVYFDNIATVSQMLYDAEKVISDSHRDTQINNAENNIFALNLLSFTSSNGSPYQAIKMVDATGTLRLTKNTNVFLKGAFDGTMTLALMDELVADDVSLYNDPTSEYNDIVAHPASTLYDSGFAMATKLALPKMIAYRKDTYVNLSTYAWNNAANLLADQISIGVALKTALEMYPESDHFGTSVVRGTVLVGSGKLANSLYKKRLPTNYELLNMASRCMGSSSGVWNMNFMFDKTPHNILTQLVDLDTTWVPTPTRGAMWNIGLTFPLNYRVKQQFFPAIQTAYEYDTSVLNSYFVMVACAYLNKIAHAAWRKFTGAITLSPAQLVSEVNKFVADECNGKFGDVFKIIPMAKVTEYDAMKGYRWTLPIKLGANNMRSVMTTWTEVFVKSDMEE